jgi:TatA/E family protein of Tat protein translocase
MAGLTPAHLLIILVIALIVIGPGKLPEVGAAIGKSFREFQKAAGQIQDPVNSALAAPQAQPQQPIAAPQQPMAAPQQPMAPQAPAQSFYAAQPAYPGQPYPAQPVPGGYYPQPGVPQAPGYPPQAYGVTTYPAAGDYQGAQPPAYPPAGYVPAPQVTPVAYPQMPGPAQTPPEAPRVD